MRTDEMTDSKEDYDANAYKIMDMCGPGKKHIQNKKIVLFVSRIVAFIVKHMDKIFLTACFIG